MIPTLTEPPVVTGTLPTPPKPRQGLTTWQILGRVAAILIAAGISLGVFFLIPDIERFKYYGYPGVFLISLIGNATVVLPVPSLAITFTMGAVLSWPIVGLVAGVGEALGETTGYLAGLGGRAVIENREMYERLQYWMEHHGMLTIFVLSVIPNPFIDLAGISAGALKYGFHKFLFAAWVGKTVKTLFFAWAGSQSVDWLMWFVG
jgi:membrane protein DedA with SNARE-associated domain